MFADLHLHSTVSDGYYPPGAVVEMAHAAGLDAIALADHDSVAGVPEAAEAATRLGVTLVPAVEWSAGFEGREFHILGYGGDHRSAATTTLEARRITQRIDRARAILERLRAAGLPVAPADLAEVTDPENVAVTRAHVARLLIARGVVAGNREAFDRWLGRDRPGFVAGELPPMSEVIGTIRESGGIAVWAHPPASALDAYLDRFVEVGLAGVECWRPRTPREAARKLARRCKRAGLIPTGGSDWHGRAHETLGEFRVEGNRLQAFSEALGVSWMDDADAP